MLLKFIKYISLCLLLISASLVTWKISGPTKQESLWSQSDHNPYRPVSRNLASQNNEHYLSRKYKLLKDYLILPHYNKQIKWNIKITNTSKNKNHQKLITLAMDNTLKKLMVFPNNKKDRKGVEIINENLLLIFEKELNQILSLSKPQKLIGQVKIQITGDKDHPQNLSFENSISPLKLSDKGRLSSLIYDSPPNFIEKVKSLNLPKTRSPFQFFGGEVIFNFEYETNKISDGHLLFRRFFRINDSDSMPLNLIKDEFKLTQSSFNSVELSADQYLTIDYKTTIDNQEAIILIYPGLLQTTSEGHKKNYYKSGDFYIHGEHPGVKFDQRFRVKLKSIKIDLKSDKMVFDLSKKRSHPKWIIPKIKDQLESNIGAKYLKQLKLHHLHNHIKEKM